MVGWEGEVAEARGQVYLTLSRCFLTPDDGLVSELVGKRAESLGRAIHVLRPRGYEIGGLEELRGELDRPDLDLHLLRSEHTRVFVTSAPRVPCPPYESVYRTEDRLVMSDHAIDVLNTYREFGLDRAEDFRDLPEHVSAELEFMAYLTRLEGAAPGAGVDPVEVASAELEFIETHLAAWIPPFADCVRQNSKHPLYRAAARALREFLESDESFLRGVV